MFKKIWNDFKSSSYSKSIPSTSPTIAISLISGALAFKSSIKLKGLMVAPFSTLCSAIFESPLNFKIPKSNSLKPTLMFDIKDLLVVNRFSLSRFDFVTLKRSYYDVFLFNMAQYYEMILLSEI